MTNQPSFSWLLTLLEIPVSFVATESLMSVILNFRSCKMYFEFVITFDDYVFKK